MRAIVAIAADYLDEDYRTVLQVAEADGPEAVDAGKLIEALGRASDIGMVEVELID